MKRGPQLEEVFNIIGQTCFPGIIPVLLDGGRFTREEWDNPSIFIFMNELGFLSISKEDGTSDNLILHTKDLNAEDWVQV